MFFLFFLVEPQREYNTRPKMEEILPMDGGSVGGANDVAVHDGIHDHFCRGTSFFRLQSVSSRSRLFGRNLR